MEIGYITIYRFSNFRIPLSYYFSYLFNISYYCIYFIISTTTLTLSSLFHHPSFLYHERKREKKENTIHISFYLLYPWKSVILPYIGSVTFAFHYLITSYSLHHINYIPLILF